MFLATSARKEYEVFQMELAEMDIEPNRVTPEAMQRITQETAKDPVLAFLCSVITSGWPAERKENARATKAVLEFQRRHFCLRWSSLSISPRHCPFFVMSTDVAENTQSAPGGLIAA